MFQETGSSLRANQLRVVDTVLESTPRLIANRDALANPWKKQKLERMRLLLQGAIQAASRVGLMLNVQRADLDAILALLPALATPTVSPLADSDWVSVTTVLEERLVRDLLPQLSEKGGQGIVEYPLNKIVE